LTHWAYRPVARNPLTLFACLQDARTVRASDKVRH